MTDERYPADGIEGTLQKYLGTSRLRQVLTPVIVTSYEIERRMPFFFRSTRATQNAAYDFPLAEVARATSAAPTYFEPARIPAGPGDYYSLIDGGVFANNPAMCAYAEAMTLFPGEEILVVSLGTGELTRRIPYEDAKDWGLLGWSRPVLDVVFDGVSDAVDYQLTQLLPDVQGTPRYYRFQIRLDDGSDDMDDVTPSNLRALQLTAQKLVSERQAAIAELAARL